MKTIKYLSMAAIAATLLASCGGGEKKKDEPKKDEAPKAVTYVVNAAESKIEWHGEKNAEYGHSGTIGIKSGELTMEADKITTGKFEVDMNTMAEPGNADTESAGKLIGHLGDSTFFDVMKFPTAMFEISSAEKTETGYTISGNITIKGITKALSFPATVTADGKMLDATAEFTFNRVDFGVSYGSVATGAKPEEAISDTISIKVTLKAAAKE